MIVPIGIPRIIHTYIEPFERATKCFLLKLFFFSVFIRGLQFYLLTKIPISLVFSRTSFLFFRLDCGFMFLLLLLCVLQVYALLLPVFSFFFLTGTST